MSIVSHPICIVLTDREVAELHYALAARRDELKSRARFQDESFALHSLDSLTAKINDFQEAMEP